MRCKWLGATLFFILISVVAAQTIGAAEAQSPTEKEGAPSFFLITVLTAAFAMTIGSVAAAFAQSKAIVAALDGIARQPSAAGRIQTTMIIGLAMIESLAIYVLLIALILFFANPFLKFVTP